MAKNYLIRRKSDGRILSVNKDYAGRIVDTGKNMETITVSDFTTSGFTDKASLTQTRTTMQVPLTLTQALSEGNQYTSDSIDTTKISINSITQA